jgi:ABC-type dipeptide/oligopeptide/nickel transport system permease component
LLKLAPGDPIHSIVGERVSEQRLEEIKKTYQLDTQAWWKQYGLYIKNIFSGNLGRSYITRQPVLRAYADRFPNTLRLAGVSVLLAVIAGLVIGVAGAYIRSPLFHQLFTLFTSFGISTPVFWFGLFLIYIFARVLMVLPASGMGNGELAYIVLPAVTLASRSAAYLARMTKTSLEQVRDARFILAVKARGIVPVAVMLKHTMKNALIPIITLIGLDFGSYLNGSVLTETIFCWNGVGRYLVYSIGQRDYPVIMGGILMGTVIFIMVNIIMDFCYAWVDPRIELK